MIDPAALYRDLMLCRGENYTPTDMVRDFKTTFSTDQGQRVLATLWSSCMLTAPGVSDAELRVIEGKRALIQFMLEMASAKAREDGSIEIVSPPEIVAQTGNEHGGSTERSH